VDFDEETKSLLGKGCKFTPHPKKNLENLEKDVSEFCRMIKLKDYFKDTIDQPNTLNYNLKYNRTNFIPPRGINNELDVIVDLINKNTLEYQSLPTHQKYNLTRSENIRLQELKNNTSLHITKADKGGSFVIMDNDFYVNHMISEHTSDSQTYDKVSNYTPHLTINKIKSLCKKFNSVCRLTKKEFDYLTNFNYVTPYLYGLPKIHKLKEEFGQLIPDQFGYIKIRAPRNLKFRPIISSTFAPTSHISAFIDEILKPIIPEVRSYCRDTYHFLEKLRQQPLINSNTLLVSFDIISLYTSIPHSLGLDSVKFWLDKEKDKLPDRFPADFILSGIDLILKNNYFQFCDNIYLQKAGTAMGTKMAPTYAILVMGFLEEKMYTIIKDIYHPNIGERIINSWVRYIDDCWITWYEEYGTIDLFQTILRNLHPSIQFTKEASYNELNFLDVRVFKEGDKLETDIFHKESDSRSYVPYYSAHPKHILHNIPFTLARRIHSIVSKPGDRHVKLDELKKVLINLKYPLTVIDNAFRKASTTIPPRTSVTPNNKEVISFISTYNKNNPNIYEKVILPACNSLKLLRPFQNCRFRRTYKQPRSLLNILNKNNKSTIKGITKCMEARCTCCDTLITGKVIKLKSNTGFRDFTINHNLNCLSHNVIYILICKGCNDFYIGQTGNMFRNRLTLHRQHIAQPCYAILNVSKHIASCTKNVQTKFQASPIIQLSPHSNKNDRELKEKQLIEMLHPRLNA